ncbi:MAG: hypothetical protein U0414_14965 [Polyangiaceae bacterium]
MTRILSSVWFMALVASCSSAVSPPSTSDGEAPSTASSAPTLKELVQRKIGAERASLTASGVDYASIPLLGVPTTKCLWDDPPPDTNPCGPFPLTSGWSTPKCAADERPHPRRLWSFGNMTSATTVLRPARTRGAEGGQDAGSRDEWTWITRPSGSDALFVVRFAGELRDPGAERMSGVATSRRKVAAKAVVPHQVYVFRSCDSACDAPLGAAERTERVTMIGPPSVWVGSSGDPADAPLSGDQPFTMISSVVKPGAAASLSIAYTSVAGSRFQGAENVNSVSTNVQTVMLEIVWDADAPELTVYRGTIPAGAASDVAEVAEECEPASREAAAQ